MLKRENPKPLFCIQEPRTPNQFFMILKPLEKERNIDEIGDYMISTVLSIDIDSSVQEAAIFMTANNISVLYW